MFNRNAEPSRTPAPRTSGGSTFSILGADTRIKGDITASADLHIDGHVEGDITCAALVQGESSEIVGVVTAQTARLAGRLRGSIAAGELVILRSAWIEGDVTYDALTIEQGARVDGRFAPRLSDAGAEAAADAGEQRLILASSNPAG
jgi:cytoskeletal protein CcmA (bactofilin family)